jgi:CRISP-associated protein Cas1
MRHLTVTEYGQFLGTAGNMLVVKSEAILVLETPLSRLRSITIAKEGVSFSSNLVMACANRGIRLFILDWRGVAVASLSGRHQHTVAELRRQQFIFLQDLRSRATAAGMIYGKLRNQRAVLLYFSKYQRTQFLSSSKILIKAAESIAKCAAEVKLLDWSVRISWREEIMGYEGAAANSYWHALRSSELLPSSFQVREGRGAQELTNQLLNYGYTLLTSYVWSALDNAGFELYAGILHSQRPGKPALVLDMMEEYRAWVVDRNVIKMRTQIGPNVQFDGRLKKRLSNHLHATMANTFPYRGKRLKLETILQRQAYRLAATVVEEQRYQPYRFRW